MLELGLLVMAAWGLLTLVGGMVLAGLRPTLRNQLLPAAPLVGAAFLVVALHATGLFLSVRQGLAVVLVAAGGSLVIGLRTGAARPFLDRSALLWTLTGIVVAIPLTAVALAPSLHVGDPRVVSALPSNDAVWYVSVSSWLAEHSILDVPEFPASVQDVGNVAGPNAATPADGPALSSLTIPLRLGQELVQAALGAVTGTSPLDTFTPWLAVWVLLVPGGCLAASALLGLGRVVGLVAGIVVASSTVFVQQVYNQNAASVLGIALAPVVLASVVAAIERDRRAPLLFAGLMLSGFVGTYTEYAPFVAPAIAGAMLRRHDLRTTLARAAGVLAIAVVIAPLVWVRALQSVMGVRGGAADSVSSPFLDASIGLVVNRLAGVGAVSPVASRSLTLVLAGLIVLGAVLAAILGPHRGLVIGFFAGGASFIAWVSLQGLGYTQRRAVEIAFPVALFISVTGYGALVHRPRRAGSDTRYRDVEHNPRLRGAMPVRMVALGALALGAVGVWSVVNVRSSLSAFEPQALQDRHVDGSFTDAREWVRDVGGPDGERVSVLVPSFFEQQWITLTLTDQKAVEYPALRPDYLRTGSFWGGGMDRFWLVGEGVQVDAEPGMLVQANARFRLFDLSRGDAVIAAPFGLERWNTEASPEGGFTTLGDAEALIVRTPGAAGTVALTLRALSSEPLEVSVQADGSRAVVLESQAMPSDGVRLALPSDDPSVIVDISARGSGRSRDSTVIELTGVRRDR